MELLGYRVASVDLEEAARMVLSMCEANEPRLIVTLNPEIVVRAREDAELRKTVEAADLVVADGVGVLWAARRLGCSLPGRVPGVELAARVMELGSTALPVFFLGGRPGIAERAAAAARRRWGITVAGSHHGYFSSPEEVGEVVEAVRASGARLLLAGLGEEQELFLHRHRQGLGARALIGVGGTLDVLAGEVRRTPAWTRRLGLEWAWRVGLDRRRWHRVPRLAAFVRLVLAESGPGRR